MDKGVRKVPYRILEGNVTTYHVYVIFFLTIDIPFYIREMNKKSPPVALQDQSFSDSLSFPALQVLKDRLLHL